MKKLADQTKELTGNLLDDMSDPAMLASLERLRQSMQGPKHRERIAAQKQINEARGKAAAKVIQLPLWPEPARGVPNSVLRGSLFAAIQGKNRRYTKRELLAAQDGMQIRFTGMQLDQSDLDVWEQALHLAREHPLGTRCTFTAHAFLKALGRGTGKSQHEQLKDNFARLAGAVVEITHNGLTYGGGMLKFYREEQRQIYALEIDATLRQLYTAGWSSTDWEQRKALRGKPLALWLHGFYATHAAPLPHRVATLHRLCGSTNKCLRGYKRELKKSHDVLEAIGAINNYTIEGDLVSVKRTPSNSQKKHLRKAKPRRK